MCEYCKEDMESKSISNKYAIETIGDGEFLYNDRNRKKDRYIG